ncbi:MAG TPA: hypothetical protein PLB32_13255 [Acidobacteriota bacterium]|nr:hypothetical protein [Acidobacteriota bacterium]HNG93763.1 hypothetical protein [Acidobacteriota bacterium]HNH82421.1 hypothetical protein [Acidobacteriota bacterium]
MQEAIIQSTQSAAMASTFLILLGAVLSGIIFFLMSDNRSRRSEFWGYEFSKKTSLITAGLLFSAMLIYVYIQYWTVFYSFKFDGQSLALHYALPGRSKVLVRTEIKNVSYRLENAKTFSYSLIIVDQTGKEYVSIPGKRETIIDFAHEIEDQLRK